MTNPWLKKNPWLSMWMSGANAVLGSARARATAEAKRQAGGRDVHRAVARHALLDVRHGAAKAQEVQKVIAEPVMRRPKDSLSALRALHSADKAKILSSALAHEASAQKHFVADEECISVSRRNPFSLVEASSNEAPWLLRRSADSASANGARGKARLRFGMR
jgi:hypothetical protein